MRLKSLLWLGLSFIFLSGCMDEAAGEIREVNPELVFSTEEFSDELQVHFFYLEPEETEKTGESILITTPGGQNILIDAGIPDVGPLVDEYLTDLGVDTIDIAMPSHPHSDHIGGYITLFDTKEIGQVLSTGFPLEESDVFQDYKEAIEKNNIPLEFVEQGDIIEVEEDLTLEVLSPAASTVENYLDTLDSFPAGVVNDLSMVVKLNYGDTSFLFTGDIYSAVESRLVDDFAEDLEDVDVLAAPHHGQHTSSSSKFLEGVNPEISVIPINLLYSYSVYENYLEISRDVYTSHHNGNVLIVSNGEKLDVYKEREEEVIEEGENE